MRVSEKYRYTYQSWKNMRGRCITKSHIKYPTYGGNGITCCDAWKTFKGFLADMGERPFGKTLDRINNSLGYFPENCRWATPTQQMINRKQKPNRTGFLGVWFDNSIPRKPWRACISANNRTIHLGNFETAELAAKARDKKASELHGPDAVLNFKNF